MSGKRCKVTKLIIQKPNEVIESINGQTGKYYHQKKITILDIEFQNVSYVPQGLEKLLPQLAALVIIESELKSISQSDLKVFKHLVELDLRSNDLVALDGDLLIFNPMLKSIHFGFNKLRYIGENITLPLRNLEEAFFIGNICTDMSVWSPEQFSNLTSELRSKCPPPKVVMKNYCNDVVTDLEDKNQKLHQEINKLKAQILTLRKKERACDGNLDVATRNWFALKQPLKACENQKGKLKTELVHSVDFICQITSQTCKAIELKVNFRNSSVDEVRTADETSVNILELKAIDQQTTFLPKNIASTFPNLTKISIIASGLFEIEPEAFKDMEDLETLILSHNNVREISSGAFKYLKKLQCLDLSHNKIESFEVEPFTGLKNLQSLTLSQNHLTKISGKIFSDLVGIKELFLQSNSIKFVRADFLQFIRQLQLLDFTNNDCINTVHPNQSLTNISDIISDNCVEPLEIYCIFEEDQTCLAQELEIEYPKTNISMLSGNLANDFDMNNVTNLSVINQTMLYFPSYLAEFLPKLNEIIIDGSFLSALQKHDFADLIELRQLKIIHNNITFIDNETFDTVVQIQYIDLSANNIDSLPTEIFSKLVHLNILILSRNRIKAISAKILPPRNIIKEFRMDNNQLESIDTEPLQHMENANIIDFTANTCIDLKFDKIEPSGKNFGNLYFKVDINCKPIKVDLVLENNLAENVTESVTEDVTESVTGIATLNVTTQI